MIKNCITLNFFKGVWDSQTLLKEVVAVFSLLMSEATGSDCSVLSVLQINLLK